MVELDAGQDRGARAVVEELRPLVEVRRVVLVALDHEVRPVAEPEVRVVVPGDAPDQERRIPAGGGEHVSQERRRRGLAVSPRHHDRVALPQEERPERRREAHLGEAARAHLRRLGVHPADHVPDDDEVGLDEVEVRRVVRREHRNRPGPEHVAHGRVDVLVASGHLVAGRLQHAGEGAHPRSGDADEVDPAGAGRIDVVEDETVVRRGHETSVSLSGSDQPIPGRPTGAALPAGHG